MVCLDYCGVACVDCTCTVALDDCHVVCDECSFYKGCEDCAFCDELDQCVVGHKKENKEK